MPAVPSWLHRLPEIRAELQELDAPIIDRAVVERVFRLGRRQAIDLMHRLGGYQIGRTFVSNREWVLSVLSEFERTMEFGRERRRIERVEAKLEELRRYRVASRVRIPVEASAFDQRLAQLPSSVHLDPGRLTIAFHTPEELLQRLFELAQAIANDYERFLRRVAAADAQAQAVSASRPNADVTGRIAPGPLTPA